jgi:hypothetical protein
LARHDNLPTLVCMNDPATGLRAAAALRKLAEYIEAVQVRNARTNGWSWQSIADALGVSRQDVHRKHAHQMPR